MAKNPVAKALRSPHLRKRIVKARKGPGAYSRKGAKVPTGERRARGVNLNADRDSVKVNARPARPHRASLQRPRPAPRVNTYKQNRRLIRR